MVFRYTLLTIGGTLIALGMFATLANNLPIIDVPNYSQKGNIITGIILIFIGMYMLIIGILDKSR